MKFIDNETKMPKESISDPDSADGFDCRRCENCDKTFRRMATLKVHMKIFYRRNNTKTKNERETSRKLEDQRSFEAANVNKMTTGKEEAPAVNEKPGKDWLEILLLTCQLPQSKMDSRRKDSHLVREPADSVIVLTTFLGKVGVILSPGNTWTDCQAS